MNNILNKISDYAKALNWPEPLHDGPHSFADGECVRCLNAKLTTLRARVEELEKASAWTPMYLKSLNARATVEQELFNVANGKTPIPDREQFRQWALKLGVPDGWGNEQHQAARGKPNE